MTPDDASFVAFVLDQMSAIAEVQGRPMFGGLGLYCRGIFFGIVYGGRLYFRSDDTTRKRFEARGMGPFRPNSRQTLARYYEVPVDVLEDRTELAAWAEEAVTSDPDPFRTPSAPGSPPRPARRTRP
ncbi:MAG: TfoX/Sxy family protein [Candidatus Eisenbacteria bacterium]|nr:TfoX/Sxy family protein [Candidatus Eisenbacteria bacterium]